MSLEKLRQKAADNRENGNGRAAQVIPLRKPGDVRGRVASIVNHAEPAKQFPYQTSKFTPETVETLISAIAAGNYFTTAAQLAGITSATLYRWLKWGEEEERPGYKEFYEAVMEAEAIAEAKLVHVVRTHAELDWRAGMDLLSRRFPDHWSAKNKTELTGPNGGPVELVVTYDDEN